MDRRNIVEDNDFIRARSKLTVTQFKVLLTAISRISVNETDFMRYTFKTNDLAKYCGIYGVGTSCYSNLKSACEGLMDKKIKLREGKHKEKIFPWVSTIIYDEGIVTIEIHHELKPFLLDLKKDFTKFDSNLIMQFNHYYSMKLYMLLYSKFVKINSYAKNDSNCKVIEDEIKIDDLKEILGLEKDKYQLTSGFKRRILKPACKEIEEITPFNINLKEIKEGHAVSAFKFIFEYNIDKANEYGISSFKKISIGCDDNVPEKVELSLPVENVLPIIDEYENIKKELNKYGVKDIDKIIEKSKLTSEEIKSNIDYILNKYGHKENFNIAGAIRKAISENYAGKEINKKKIILKEKNLKQKKIKEQKQYDDVQMNLFNSSTNQSQHSENTLKLQNYIYKLSESINS